MKRTHSLARALAAAGIVGIMGSATATAEAASSPGESFVITALGCQTSRTQVSDLGPAQSGCFPGSQSVVQLVVGGPNPLGRIILNLHSTSASAPVGTGALWSGCRRVAGTISSTVWLCPNGPGGKSNPAVIVDSTLKRSKDAFSMNAIVPMRRNSSGRTQSHKRSRVASVTLTGHLVPTGSPSSQEVTGVITFSYPDVPVLRWRFTTLAPTGA